MAKKPKLNDLEKKVQKEEQELEKLQLKDLELTENYLKAKAELASKIDAQVEKLENAKVNRNLYLLTHSDKAYEELKAFALGQERGGTSHVQSHQLREQ